MIAMMIPMMIPKIQMEIPIQKTILTVTTVTSISTILTSMIRNSISSEKNLIKRDQDLLLLINSDLAVINLRISSSI